LVTTTCYIISEDECSKKREEKIRGNKKGQVLGTSKERKSETRDKMDKCPTVESGVQYTHLRGKKKKKEEHLILLRKFQKSKKGMYPLKRATSRIRLHHCYHHHHHTPFIRHTCTS